MIALISVSDKSGIVEFARSLHNLGITIISTGGTASVLIEAGIPVTKVSDVTQFPEILDGRVKTLHPKIHGGLLGVISNPEHVRQMQMHGIEKIDLLVVNLYPFEETILRKGASDSEIIENIDIGGPAMVRAAAKNFEHTCVVVNPERYATVLEQLNTMGNLSTDVRLQLAREAFAHTAHYDACIAGYLNARVGAGLSGLTAIPMRLNQVLRYGENPHQTAALYGTFSQIFRQIHGKELSYNNILDINAASKLCLEFSDPTVCIIKHTNPCGVGSGDDLADAWKKAFATDSVSPFGGIVAVNREVDSSFAQTIHPIFTEVVIAPSFSAEALNVLQRKKDRRLIVVNQEMLRGETDMEVRSVAGGYLLQTADSKLIDDSSFRIVTDRKPTDDEMTSMMFAWVVAKHVKSNAIVYALSDRTLAIGAGQMSRIDSARIAVSKARDAGLSLHGCAVASDAFFPFADGLFQAAEAGATCVIQPGGSVRDEEVIRAANDKGLAMVFTGMRHFRH